MKDVTAALKHWLETHNIPVEDVSIAVIGKDAAVYERIERTFVDEVGPMVIVMDDTGPYTMVNGVRLMFGSDEDPAHEHGDEEGHPNSHPPLSVAELCPHGIGLLGLLVRIHAGAIEIKDAAIEPMSADVALMAERNPDNDGTVFTCVQIGGTRN